MTTRFSKALSFTATCAAIIFGVVTGALATTVIYEAFPDAGLWHLGILALAVPVCFFTLTFVHEMGHVVPAWVLKHKIHAVAVGKFGYTVDQLKFHIVRDYSQSEAAGYVINSPSWPPGPLWHEIVISLGGPAATFILGIILFLIGQFSVDENSAQTLLKLLALGCILDTSFNLTPRTLKNGLENDGLQINRSLIQTRWNEENWMATRISYPNKYGDPLVTNEVWSKLRQTPGPHKDNENFWIFMAALSWHKTDPEGFVHAIEALPKNHMILEDVGRWQYAASKCLMGEFEPRFSDFIPDEPPENDHLIYLFCAAVVCAKAENQDRAIKHITDFKTIIGPENTNSLKDEMQIFDAIEKDMSFPKPMWEPLRPVSIAA